jgi:hypothetical protein
MRFPGEISVPAFCVHTYFAPGGVSFTVEWLRSHPARVCSWQRPLRFDPYTLGARGSVHVFREMLFMNNHVCERVCERVCVLSPALPRCF